MCAVNKRVKWDTVALNLEKCRSINFPPVAMFIIRVQHAVPVDWTGHGRPSEIH